MTSAKDDRDGLDDAFRLLVGRSPEREDIRLAAALNEIVQRTNLDPFVVEWIAGRASEEHARAELRRVADMIASDLPSPTERVKMFCDTLAYSGAVQALIQIALPWVAWSVRIVFAGALIAFVGVAYNTGAMVLNDCSTVASYAAKHRPHGRENPHGMSFGLALESNLCKPFTP